MRRLDVNGTAKVYFVEEKAGCHATMGIMVGMPWCQRAPRDQEGYGSGKRDRVETARRGQRVGETEKERRRGI